MLELGNALFNALLAILIFGGWAIVGLMRFAFESLTTRLRRRRYARFVMQACQDRFFDHI